MCVEIIQLYKGMKKELHLWDEKPGLYNIMLEGKMEIFFNPKKFLLLSEHVLQFGLSYSEPFFPV
jgi:hypothetical protein